jgi:hypothetical protein
MTTDSFFAVMCGATIALLFGLAVCFAGYRLFLVLIPIWGFFFGLGLGAQTIQVLFPNDGFLGTVTSWVVGFIAALVFAVLSYLFYVFAVALIAGSLGYSAAVGLLTALGMDFGLIVWLIGLVAAVALAVVVLRFNIQKIVIEFATAFLGAGAMIGTFVALFSGVRSTELIQLGTRWVLQNPLWLIMFIVLGVLGLVAQIRNDRRFEVNTYNRMTTA